MIDFSYARPCELSEAHQYLSSGKRSKIVAGGTNLIDLLRADVMHPEELIDINQLKELKTVSDLPDGGLRVGALVTNSDLAYHPQIERRYPLLSKTILAGASPQLRNMATTGGNLLQRTRCAYFYDTAMRCNKRNPGAGCAAKDGWSRMHAILGQSEHCIAVHPSDMCVALAALDAKIQVKGPKGERSIAMEDFHRLPGDTPHIDSNLAEDEVITAVDLPPEHFTKNYYYLKIRDRLSYAFALVSTAVALDVKDKRIVEARVAFGGIAHKPWRNKEAEALLHNKILEEIDFDAVANLILAAAKGHDVNDFKIPLARRALKRAVTEAYTMESSHA